MKLTGIALHASNNAEVAFLSFKDPGSLNPFIAKNIIGLDADEIVHRFSGISGASKSKYYNLTMTPREIVLNILLNPRFTDGKTYSELRDELYRGIASSRTGAMTLNFYNGEQLLAYVSGFVTKMESPHFSDKPEVQLTLLCDDPMLRAYDITFVNLLTAIGDNLVIDDDISTSPHGFTFQLTFTDVQTSFTIREPDTSDWEFTVTPGLISGVTGFKAGDKLYFSSEQSGRYLDLIRDSVRMSIVDKIAPGSFWPILFPGSNAFTNDEPVTWNTISYHTSHWGV